MSCGCNQPTTPVPSTNCNPVPAYAEPAPVVTSTPCCLGCYYEDMQAPWTKPADEAEGTPLAVCDSSKFFVDQCIFIVGSNGLGGVYKVTALLDGAVAVDPFEPDVYDIGGAGTVADGRIVPMAACPLTQAELIEIVTPAIPEEFTLAIGPTSDSAHGYSLDIDGDGKLILVYSQANFEAQVASYLGSLGVSLFKPVVNTVKYDLFNMPSPDPLADTSGTIDIASAFGVTIPPTATHVRLRVHFEVMAGNSVGAVAGDESHIIGYLRFNGSSQFAIEQYSQNVTPAVNSTESFALRNASWTHVNMDLPITGGEVTWEFSHLLYPTTGKTAAGNDADAFVRLLGFLVTP